MASMGNGWPGHCFFLDENAVLEEFPNTTGFDAAAFPFWAGLIAGLLPLPVTVQGGSR